MVYREYVRPTLRPYQLDAVAAAEHHKRGVLQLATGAGKSLALAELIRRVGGKWLVLVPQRVLREQLRSTLESYGVAEHATVSTWQAVCARVRRDPSHLRGLQTGLTGIAVDEVHTAPAPHQSALLESLHTEYRIGLSATPHLRPDGGNDWTARYFGPVVFRRDARELVIDGYLTRFSVRFVPGPDPPPGARGYQGTVTHHRARNELLARLAAEAAGPTLVLVNHVAHARQLFPQLHSAGVEHRFVEGDTPDAERRGSLAWLQQTAKTLVATPVFNVGVDIPALRTGIVGSGGKSAIACMQRLGRGLRLAPDKHVFTLLDIADVGSERLAANTRARAEAYAMAGYDVELGVAEYKPITLAQASSQDHHRRGPLPTPHPTRPVLQRLPIPRRSGAPLRRFAPSLEGWVGLIVAGAMGLAAAYVLLATLLSTGAVQ